jgi:hypothetical protein
LLQNLARLDRRDSTWCTVRKFIQNDEIRYALGSLDPMLANLVHNGDMFQFGIRYHRRVRFEYEVTTASGVSAQAISSSFSRSLIGKNAKGSSLMPGFESGDVGSARGVVEFSRTRYEKWLAEVSSRSSRLQTDR